MSSSPRGTSGIPLSATDPKRIYLGRPTYSAHRVCGADNRVHELWWSGNWHTNDPSTVAGMPPESTGNMFGYFFVAQST
jgi:hypothetical protein